MPEVLSDVPEQRTWYGPDLRLPNPFGLAGLVIAAPMAVAGDWSLAEFCWSTWLAGLLFTWLCILTGGLQILFAAPAWRAPVERHVPALGRLSPATGTALIVVAVICLMAVSFYAYTLAFGFYGLFLSFFAEMEPHSLFGRNGFINSDFWMPVRYLAVSFWAMSMGTVVACMGELVASNPWRRMLLPAATQVVRVHIMVVAMPFLALIAWAVFGDSYQSLVIVLLMGMFYLLPGRGRQQSHSASAQPVLGPEHTTEVARPSR